MRNACIRPKILLAALMVASPAMAAEPPAPTPEQVKFFETKVRPVLVEHCYRCHGPDKQRSDLRVDSLEGLLEGGVAGPAIVAGDPGQSLLIEAINHTGDLKMPPKEKLADRQIADLTEWVRMGAPFPLPPNGESPSAKGRDFWSFKPPADPPVPAVKNTTWPTSDLDRFVLAGLESKGLRPAPAADKRTLIRRATFDLTGLPPTPEEVEAFLADTSAEAFARLVDRLLASPAYGERWGRHWLDVARYADSNGLDENVAYGNAWRYRDYVVNAFNRDKPYDQFLLEQIAGDLLPPTDDLATKHERLIATGFLALGPKVLAEVDEQKMEMDIIDEQVDTLGRSVLGLTLGCARCHDHKFDPIKTEDYYALAGIFKSTRTMEHFKKVARWYENSLATEQDLALKAAHDKRVAEAKAAIQSVIDTANEKLKAAAAAGTELPKNPESMYPPETQAELKQKREALKELEKAAPVMPVAMGVTEGTVVNVAVHLRGNHLTLGAEVPRRFPLILAGTDQPPLDLQQSGRLQLAQWLVSRDHPLTSRVMANRIWRWHFGQGLVRSTDNFGRLGDAPVNQPLLDWLAHRFMQQNWSIKAMHRLIMLSSTYQMSSDYDPQAAEVDSENHWHWRADIQRLEAEEIRDALLAVAGTLDRTIGGSLLHVKDRDYFFDHTSRDGTRYDSRRRALYLPVVRNNVYDVFQLFDFADPSVLSGNRDTTTIAPQALFMLNSELVLDASESLAARVLEQPDLDDAGRIQLVYQRAYGRPAAEAEIAKAAALVEEISKSVEPTQSDPAKRRLQAWASLCQVVLAANEFIYVR